MKYTAPFIYLPSRADIYLLRYPVFYLVGLIFAAMLFIFGSHSCFVSSELWMGVFYFSGLIVLLLAPLLVPIIAALLRARRWVFASLIGAQLTSLPVIYYLHGWQDAHLWDVHSHVSMGVILAIFYAGYSALLALITTGVFFLVHWLRRRSGR